MASGLGAIILVLILVKQGIETPTPAQANLLNADLSSIEAQRATQQQSLASLNQQALAEMAAIKQTQASIAALKAQTAQKITAVSQQQAALSSIKKTINNAPHAHKDDIVQSQMGGEEQYIMGLKVEGKKILFLIDASASMTDEKLIDIIRRKSSADRVKKQAPKWQRSKRIVRWMLARTPKSSQIAVVAYNNQVKMLGSSIWFSSRDANSIARVYSDLDQLVPSGSTNLQRGLQKAARLKPSNIYLLTDGLPTAGQSRYARLNPFSSCSSLLGRSSNISGACRVKLFRQSISESTPGQNTRVNVILLPIEGDPQAAPEYWRWTAATGGLLISPAMSWP